MEHFARRHLVKKRQSNVNFCYFECSHFVDFLVHCCSYVWSWLAIVWLLAAACLLQQKTNSFPSTPPYSQLLQEGVVLMWALRNYCVWSIFLWVVTPAAAARAAMGWRCRTVCCALLLPSCALLAALLVGLAVTLPIVWPQIQKTMVEEVRNEEIIPV